MNKRAFAVKLITGCYSKFSSNNSLLVISLIDKMNSLCEQSPFVRAVITFIIILSLANQMNITRFMVFFLLSYGLFHDKIRVRVRRVYSNDGFSSYTTEITREFARTGAYLSPINADHSLMSQPNILSLSTFSYG